MRMKTFTGASMRDALAAAKRELGGQAVILGTRSYQTGGFLGFGRRTVVEVTAGRGAAGQKGKPGAGPGRGAKPSGDERSQAPSPGEATVPRTDGRLKQTYGQFVKQARDQAAQVAAQELRGEIGDLKELVHRLVRETRHQKMPDVPEELFDAYVALLSNEVADDMAKELVKRICAELPESEWGSAHRVRQCLVRYVASRIDVAGPTSLDAGPSPRVIALVGPTGVGKTTTIAKLAAQFKLKQNCSVGLITIDTYRIAAVDQLRTYAEIIDVPLRVVLTPKELRRAIDEYADKDVVLLDTAGRSQRDVLKMNELRQFLEAARPDETHLVISGTSSPQTASAVVERFAEFDVDRIVLTKLDEAVGFGMVLTVLEKAQRKLSYVTVGQDVPEDIEAGDPRKLAELIVPAAGASGERTVQ